MSKLLKDAGYEVLVQEANHDAKLQNDQIKNMVTQGAKVIIVVAEDGDSAATAVEDVAKKGVKVIAYDRLIKTAKIAAYVSFDNVDVGRNQAKGVLAVKSSGNFVLLGGSPTDNNAHLFRQGQMEVLNPLIESGKIKVVADQWVENWDPANAKKLMENILTATGKKFDAVVASNDGTALGALEAMKTTGLAGKVPISGQDATEAGCNSIARGELTVTILKDTRKLTPLASELAVKLAKGEKNLGLSDFKLAELTGDSKKKGQMPGKSTLMKILCGVYPHGTYQGDVVYDGKVLRLGTRSIRQAIEEGIAIVYQELTLVPKMTVGENIYLGKEPRRGRSIDWDKLYSDTASLLKRYKLKVSPLDVIEDLGVGQMQMTEIAKALSENARVLILDEPTSALSAAEADQLMEILRELKYQGVTCIYISHQLE